MSNEENATASTLLASLALIAILAGEWMTRPRHLDLPASILAAVVIYVIVAGAPQMLIFGAAASCSRQGYVPPAGWWTVAYVVFLMQFVAGATFIIGAIAGQEALSFLAAAVLTVAALVALASGLAASTVAYKPGT